MDATSPCNYAEIIITISLPVLKSKSFVSLTAAGAWEREECAKAWERKKKDN